MKTTNTNHTTHTPDGNPADAIRTATAPTIEKTPAPIGAQAFPRLYRYILKYYKADLLKEYNYIKAKNKNVIKYYLTPAKLTAYNNGTLDEKTAQKYARAKAEKENEKRKAATLEKLNAAALAPDIIYINIAITWARSYMWGYNPTAEILTDKGERATGTASGCGYDKESAATANGLNQINSIKKILYTAANKALKNGNPHSATACTRCDWRDLLGYGSGYAPAPYFEGGGGQSSLLNVLKNAGFSLNSQHHAKTFDGYTLTRTPAPVKKLTYINGIKATRADVAQLLKDIDAGKVTAEKHTTRTGATAYTVQG